MVDKDSDIGEELARRGDEQKGKRAPIDAHPIRASHSDGLQGGVALQRNGEFSELAVHQRGNSGYFAGLCCRLYQGLNNCAARRAKYAPVEKTGAYNYRS